MRKDARLRSPRDNFGKALGSGATWRDRHLDDSVLGRPPYASCTLPENGIVFSRRLRLHKDRLRGQERRHGSKDQNGCPPDHRKSMA